MTVVRLDRKDVSEQQTALLETVDSLRAAILDGTIAGFVAVGIESNDVTRQWSCGPSISRLRMMGAIASLQFGFHLGE